MIEIRNRWDNTVLYTAENAQNVRQAVEEARASDANLRDANLSRAYLRDADLSGADLSRAYLRDADLSDAYLRDANLRGADLSRAYLRDANLRDANLSRADLRDANLRDANLSDADLSGAYLSGADLRDARGIAPERCTDLLMLRDQVGKVRAYKLTTADGTGPFSGGLAYVVGEVVEVGGANTDPDSHCGAGVNLATLPWCLNEWRPGYRIFVCEFTARDIAAIPTATDGKFRTHRCKVVREIPREQIESWINPKESE